MLAVRRGGGDATARPAGRPAIIVDGRKPPAMRRAGALGDGWMPFLFSPDQYAQSVRLVRDHAVTVGRDLSSFHWMCFVYVSVARDAAEARRKALDFIGGAGGRRFPLDAVVDRVAALGRRRRWRRGRASSSTPACATSW